MYSWSSESLLEPSMSAINNTAVQLYTSSCSRKAKYKRSECNFYLTPRYFSWRGGGRRSYHVTGIAWRDGTGDRASTSGHPSCGSIHICVWVADFMQTSCNRLIHSLAIVHDSSLTDFVLTPFTHFTLCICRAKSQHGPLGRSGPAHTLQLCFLIIWW